MSYSWIIQTGDSLRCICGAIKSCLWQCLLHDWHTTEQSNALFVLSAARMFILPPGNPFNSAARFNSTVGTCNKHVIAYRGKLMSRHTQVHTHITQNTHFSTSNHYILLDLFSLKLNVKVQISNFALMVVFIKQRSHYYLQFYCSRSGKWPAAKQQIFFSHELFCCAEMKGQIFTVLGRIQWNSSFH